MHLGPRVRDAHPEDRLLKLVLLGFKEHLLPFGLEDVELDLEKAAERDTVLGDRCCGSEVGACRF